MLNFSLFTFIFSLLHPPRIHRLAMNLFQERQFGSVVTLEDAHCLYQHSHVVWVAPLYGVVRFLLDAPCHEGDVGLQVVLHFGCPSLYDALYGFDAILRNIVTQYDECCPYAESHIGELLEHPIGVLLSLAHPVISYSDVQWVAVSDSSWFHSS